MLCQHFNTRHVGCCRGLALQASPGDHAANNYHAHMDLCNPLQLGTTMVVIDPCTLSRADKDDGGDKLQHESKNERGTRGERIRHLRQLREMTQVQVAKAVGVTQGAISQLERDQNSAPSAATLLALANALQASPEWIQHGTGPMALEGESEERMLLSVWRRMGAEQRRAFLSAARALVEPEPPDAA